MSDTLAAATIAGLVAITVAYLTQFLSEAYKRHRDGSAVAAAIAGELASYAPALPILCDLMRSWKRAIAEGRRGEIAFRPMEKPTDLVIGEMVSKLGLLGVEHVEKIALVYGNVRGFRNGFEIILRDHAEMTDAELSGRCDACLMSLDRAHREGVPLVAQLKARARQKFLRRLPDIDSAPSS